MSMWRNDNSVLFRCFDVLCCSVVDVGGGLDCFLWFLSSIWFVLVCYQSLQRTWLLWYLEVWVVYVVDLCIPSTYTGSQMSLALS